MRSVPEGRRVVITGMGAVTSLGPDLASTWKGVISGDSGIRLIRQYGELTPPTHVAGQVDLSLLPALKARPGSASVMSQPVGRAATFALHAAEQAWQHARLDDSPPLPREAGVCIGASTFPIIEDRLEHIAALLEGSRWNPKRYAELCYEHPWLLTQSDAAGIASLLSDRYSLTGVSLTAQAACTSATQALGYAFRSIRSGASRLLLAGGTDSMLSMMCVTGFSLLGSLSQRWTEPSRASRPFDRTRDGFVLSEGASILVLEDLDHALARGATIRGEIIGYGCSCDAYRFTDMHPEGDGAILCMNAALRDAAIHSAQVGYINAHGTATPLNDRTETIAIRRTFGRHADRLAVSSTKSQLGHLLCAAGAIELTLTALAIEHGLLPPTINLDYPDPGCDLDYIPWVARASDAPIAITNSFGFGGQNGCLVLRRWEPKSNAAAVSFAETTPGRTPRRVVITGIGVISPLGLDVATHIAGLSSGVLASLRPAPPEMLALNAPHAARVVGFDLSSVITNRMLRKILTSAASYAVAAAGQAIASSGLPKDDIHNASLVVGSLGLDQDLNLFGEALKTSIDSDNRFSYARFTRHGTALIDPLFLVKSLPNAGLCGTAIQYEIFGPNLNIMSGSASGLLAIAAAFQDVRSGATPVAIVGGYDSTLQLEVILAHLVEGRLATHSSPDVGYVLGEGAAFFVLEDADHARARNATVYAEITGASHAHSTAANAADTLHLIALEALGDILPPDAIFGDGLDLPGQDALECAVSHQLKSSSLLRTSTAATGCCGVASPLFSLLHATCAVSDRSVNRPLVWTSDHKREHVAVALGAFISDATRDAEL
jgi:3-oxoacyl-[acyl-carrier-protein] synthase II